MIDATPPTERPKKKRWRRALRVLAFVSIAYGVPVLSGCMNMSTPVDYVMNIGVFPMTPELRVADDGVRRLVVLRHGLWRSAGALWKLERALESHGYEVLNLSYPSTTGTIQDHARLLREQLEAVVQGDTDLELYFVGHSMGGVQIRYYLSQPYALRPTACVFIATPHRGAILTNKRKDWWLFKLFLGDEGALQLRPGDPIFAAMKPLRCDCGVVFGGLGDGKGYNDDIPGDDDGTVSIDEAQLPEAKDRVRLKMGHTRLTIADASLRQVLHFLKFRRFAK